MHVFLLIISGVALVGAVLLLWQSVKFQRDGAAHLKDAEACLAEAEDCLKETRRLNP